MKQSQTSFLPLAAEKVVDQRVRPPEGVLHQARRAILNALGASVAGVAHPGVTAINHWSASRATQNYSPALWLGGKHSPENAAMVNGALIHVLDFDDTDIASITHPTTSVLSAMLADPSCIELNGSDFLSNLVVGTELHVRLALSMAPHTYPKGFQVTSVTGALGAAAAVGRSRKSDTDVIARAMSISLTGSVALMANLGYMTKAYGVGNLARAGIVSVDLAERGLTASLAAVEERNGVMTAYSSRENLERPLAELKTLGEQWMIMNSLYKEWSTATANQASVEAALRLRSRIPADKRRTVTGFHVTASPPTGQSHTRAVRPLHPGTDLEAKFDLSHCVAVAWIAGEFNDTHLSAKWYEDPEVLRVRDLVQGQGSDTCTLADANVVATFADGSSLEEVVRDCKGSTRNPLTDADLERKFRAGAAAVLTTQHADDVIAAVWALGKGSPRRLLELAQVGKASS